jgi:hypothetical protein
MSTQPYPCVLTQQIIYVLDRLRSLDDYACLGWRSVDTSLHPQASKPRNTKNRGPAPRRLLHRVRSRGDNQPLKSRGASPGAVSRSPSNHLSFRIRRWSTPSGTRIPTKAHRTVWEKMGRARWESITASAESISTTSTTEEKRTVGDYVHENYYQINKHVQSHERHATEREFFVRECHRGSQDQREWHYLRSR